MSVLTGDLGAQQRESRPVSGFTRVVLDGIGRVDLKQGSEDSLTVEAPERLMQWIETKVHNGTLHLSFRRGLRLHDVGRLRIVYEVCLRGVDALAINGAGSIATGPLRTGDFSLHIDGSGRIEIPDLDADSLHVEIDGAGKIELGRASAATHRLEIDGAGRVETREATGESYRVNLDGTGKIAAAGRVSEVEVRLNGTGKLELRDLQSQRAAMRIDGTGKITTWVEESLDVHINGFGKVQYRGEPSLSVHTGGFGRVTRIDEN